MIDSMWGITLSLAPWMLLGMAIAGLLHVVLPRTLVRRRLRGKGAVPLAVALGVPLPLCSCGVIPAALGLKRDGASDGATVGFLISTPQTGVDSILVSASFLGWPFALFKLVSAAVTGLVGGWLTESSATHGGNPSDAGEAEEQLAAERTVRGALDHALMILRSIWRWIVFGVVVSAMIEAWVPHGFFAGLAAYGMVVPALAALAVSLPLYVCATASVPIAAAMVANGMPAGAALVFLMAGPATNVATIGAIYRGLGRRALGIYLATIVAGSIGAALAFDFLLEAVPAAAVHHHESHGIVARLCALLLLGLLAWFAFDDLRGWLRRRGASGGSDDAIDVGVAGMSCQGCVNKLQRALLQEDGITSAVVTLEPARAVVHGAVGVDRVRSAIERAGFSVTGESDG
jgi:uncharacterized membrane protein YraQ (UPF0718 family)/copper chaperone CopZ